MKGKGLWSGNIKPREFSWDRHNRDKNWAKHQVDFRECEQVFFNRPLKTLYDAGHSQKEDRFIALGITDHGRRLSLVFTIRDRKIRIISAREQSRKERAFYDQKQ